MLLTAETAIKNVFTIFAAFWVVALLVLFFAVGLLTRKADRAAAKNRESSRPH